MMSADCSRSQYDTLLRITHLRKEVTVMKRAYLLHHVSKDPFLMSLDNCRTGNRIKMDRSKQNCQVSVIFTVALIKLF